MRFLRSTLTLLLLLLSIFIASRAMIRALPGDPLETLIAETGTTLPAEALRKELHLDLPFPQALARDLSRLSQGDLGISLFSKKPIGPILQERFGRTARLAILGLLLSLCLAIPLGSRAAIRAGSRADRFCTFYGGLTAALPMVWVGPLLLVLFSVWIPLFPSDNHLALPSLALALSTSGLWARLIRERVRETLDRGPAMAARARGIPEWKVILKYGLAPASGSLLAFLGTQFGSLLAGAFVIEAIFGWDGLGSLLIEAVLRRDYPVVEAGTFVTAACAILGTRFGDWLQNWVDPRLAEPTPGERK